MKTKQLKGYEQQPQCKNRHHPKVEPNRGAVFELRRLVIYHREGWTGEWTERALLSVYTRTKTSTIQLQAWYQNNLAGRLVREWIRKEASR
jgi:hypothetical protein